MKFNLILILLVLLIFRADKIFSGNGDIINVITHNKTKVITDPSKGFNAFKSWGIFPSEEIKYRKAVLYVTYQCPDSQRCGEWDYIDNIFLRKKRSVNDTSLDIELARMISPYGSRFLPEWKFTWKADITDFSFLLHDSVEIEFNHTGYESNTDRGWLITLDFELTEGSPVSEILGYEKLWEGKFPYGDTVDDIENYLSSITFGNKYNADFVRLRILQTGHGMDEKENCAEFCSKYRKIFFDDELIEQKQIWRECADNPLYPQAGTWIFDRANWCPGSMVNPDVYNFILNENEEHTIEIDMEPYSNPVNPSANYVFSSYLFFYKKPEFENDVSVEEIISPSDEDIYSRQNPVCTDLKIFIRNNGNEYLSGVKINYGTEGVAEKTFDWEGNLKTNESAEIILPEVFSRNKDKDVFKVRLTSPNGKEDEYDFDNVKSSVMKLPQLFNSKVIIAIKTNNEPAHNMYKITNENNYCIEQKNFSSSEKNIFYKDTLNLKPGCYEFIFKDTANDGLDFWFNAEGGYGYVRITDIDGKLLKAFNSDFGSEIRQQFVVTGEKTRSEDITPILNIFPIRNPGKFFADIFLNEKQNIILQITSEDKMKIVYEKKIKKFKEGMIDLDISKLPDGFYFVNVITKDKKVFKKMKLKRD